MQEKIFGFYEKIGKKLKISVEKEENRINLSTEKGGRIIIHLLSKPKKNFMNYFFRKTTRKKIKKITEEECKQIVLDTLTDIQIYQSKRGRFLSVEENIWEKIKEEVWEQIKEDIIENRTFFYEYQMNNTYCQSFIFSIIKSSKKGVLK